MSNLHQPRHIVMDMLQSGRSPSPEMGAARNIVAGQGELCDRGHPQRRGEAQDVINRIVAMGGGGGPALVARAFHDRLDSFTAIVSTADTGSSTGVCRRLFQIPAPGDLRATLSALAALSGQEGWAKLWETRLDCASFEDLNGMAVGNLLIAALAQGTGDFSRAVDKAARLLGLRGRVLPVTAEPVDLEAELADGSVVRGEVEVRRPGKPRIRRLGWVGTPPKPSRGVPEAIGEADLILLGPGCLYTSLLPCLMVRGIAEAIRVSRGLRVYLCNTTTTPGQTDGYSVSRHVEEVMAVLGARGLDAALIPTGYMETEVRTSYKAFGVIPLEVSEADLQAIASMGVRPCIADLLEEPPVPPRRLHKVDTHRHDPVRLRHALDELIRTLGRG